MKIFKIIIISLLSLIFLVGATFFLVGYLRPSPGGVYVDSVPSSNVYIDGKYVDKTPYKNTYEIGKVKIKLVPNDPEFLPYETELDLNAGVQSVVMYKFGKTKDESSGYTLTFEKDLNKLTSLIVVSDPENAQIFIDDIVQGFSPHKAGKLSAKKHKLTIKKNDYEDLNVNVVLAEGYTLKMDAQLQKAIQATPSPQPTPEVKTYIEITDTPTGFLRVRTEPQSKGEEIAEVKPGQKFLFLEEDPTSGWYKIQYSEPKAGLPDGIQGWVSNQYSKKVEE